MFRTRATRWISFLGFGIFLGFTIAVIVNAAIVVAVDSVPEDIAATQRSPSWLRGGRWAERSGHDSAGGLRLGMPTRDRNMSR